MKKIAYFSNTDFSLYNFRLGLMQEMKKRNFQVFGCAGVTKEEYTEKLRKVFVFKEFPLKRGIDFLGGDFRYFLKVFLFCKKEKPDICHNFTIKPCIYGTLGQSVAGVKNIYCTITGLGSSFEKETLTKKLVVFLYKVSLKRAKRVVFQNPDDKELFLKLKIIPPEKALLIKSSGVDLEYFSCDEWIPDQVGNDKGIVGNDKGVVRNDRGNVGDDRGVIKDDKQIVITLIARMLYQKGVKEFVESAKILKEKYNNLEFLLVGPVDNQNPSAIKKETIDTWHKEGLINYLGKRKDIKEILSSSDVFAFPSFYREGVPKALLEAGSMSLPLITTDTPGCREVVEDNVNGFLVEPKSSKDLAEKLEILIKDKDLRERFGKASREKIIKEFDEKLVIDKYLKEVYKINK